MKTMLTNSEKNKRFNIFIYSITIFLSLVFILPGLWTLSNSLRDVFGTPVIIPDSLHWENYYLAVTLIPFLSYLKSSLIIVAIAVSLDSTVNLLLGFAFARYRAPGKNLLFTIILSSLMIPGISYAIPQYILYSSIGLKDSYWIWVLMGLGGNAFYVFLYRQFFASIPKELEEAARIDGCSIFQIILKVFVPLSKPVIAVVAVLDFQFFWGDYTVPFMFLSPQKYPLSMALFGNSYTIEGSPTVNLFPLVNAAAVLITIPIIINFFIGQRYLVEGIVTTGIKG